jgi:cardiolipin synthase
VRCRILVDGLGGAKALPRLLKRLQDTGVHARVYHPVRVWKLMDLFRLRGTINRRNHRKVCIIDSRVAWVGSMNVCDAHLPSLQGARAWRDTGARVEGVDVRLLARAFSRAWRRTHWAPKVPRPARDPRSPWVKMNYTRGMRRRAYRALIRRLRQARRRVWVTNPYFVPPGRLVRALRAAAQAGADVRVLVPRRPDVPFIRWVAASFFAGLVSRSVAVYEYLPSPLHAKTLIVDEWAQVGSTNFNHRSVLHDLEVDIVLSKPATRDLLARQFERDLERAEPVTEAKLRSRGWGERIAGRLLFALRYWL